MKKTAKKRVKKSAKKSKPVLKRATVKMKKAEKPVGQVLHFFRKIKVAVVKFKKPVAKGTYLRFEGMTTNFREKLESMQFNHKPLLRAPKGKKIGMKVSKRVREGDSIFLDSA